ncbi:NAD(P)-dependent oxidoreductase [Nocardia camponoti]|uniref:6-phosphogluconate dehydrogenase n=1 Tax=Nocardia camponoti TaxID=1616106 RepID=A0A917QQP2_9NOCA|nr:NAD(P)-binding domain-containing protein [Nocardia camponoti]GGK64249.1 6-phosphogluconate dehydrogenase [Nocardia camponoti]
MNSTVPLTISIMGTGAMGAALAEALVAAGHRVTVWNRTRAKAESIAGAHVASTPGDAVAAAELVILALLDDETVRASLAPVLNDLNGRTLVNLTTTTPEQARAIGEWTESANVAVLDGGIMAIPSMIGGPGAFVIYSGDGDAFARYESVFELFGGAEYVGEDLGAAALYDVSILGAMYAMFAGFRQGGAMVTTAGGSAARLASMMTPFLQAMARHLATYAPGIDSPADYVQEQSDEFTAGALDLIEKAAVESGNPTPLYGALRRALIGL